MVKTVYSVDSGGLDATLAAMKAGHTYIYQAVLEHENLRGIADFLVKVDRPLPFAGQLELCPPGMQVSPESET